MSATSSKTASNRSPLELIAETTDASRRARKVKSDFIFGKCDANKKRL